MRIGGCAVGYPNVQRTAAAGTEVVLQIEYGQRTRGGLTDFLHDVTTTVLVDGAPVADADGYWSNPQPLSLLAPDVWWVTWTYPTGIVLAPGEQLVVSPALTLAHPLADPRDPGPTVIPAGLLVAPGSGFTAPGTCTITGV